MKLRTRILMLAVLSMFGLRAIAQNVATPSAGAANVETANSDYVTVGSRLPYFVNTDATIQGMTDAGTMKASIFSWNVTNAADVNVAGASILNYAGAAAAQYDKFRVPTAGTGYFDNEISILWGGPTFTAGTAYKVKVAEKSVTNSATIEGCEDATPEVKDIFVLARPTVAFVGTEGGGCATAPGSSFNVPLTVTGLGNWDVTYTVSYNGAAASGPATYTLTLAAPAVTDANVITESTSARVTGATEGLSYTLPAAQFGYYDVTITNITDRISRKSMVPLTAAGAAGTFRIYVSPTPATSPIQHIRNL